MKIIKVIFGTLCVLVFTYFFLGVMFAPKDAPNLYLDYEEYTKPWEWLHDDGTFDMIYLPVNLPEKPGKTVLIRTMLDEETVSHRFMYFHNARQDFKIYVGDELRVLYSTQDTKLTGKYTAPAHVVCPLYEEDAGKYLTLESYTESTYNGTMYNVFLGDQMGFWMKFVRIMGFDLVIAMTALLLGVICMCASIIFGFILHQKTTLPYLSLGIVLASVWLVANSNLRQVIFPTISVINDMTFSMLLLLPLPFLIYMDSVQRGRYSRLYKAVCVITLCDAIVCMTLHVAGIVDYSESFICMAIVALISFVVFGTTIIIDATKGFLREYPLVATGVIAVVICATAEIFIYMKKSDIFNTTLLEFGLIFLLIMSALNTVQGVIKIKREKETALLASESESRFLANMSHEIRTPINAILGFNAMILRESGEEDIREYAASIENAGNTLLALIKDILDIARVESGKMELTPVEYDLFGMIENVRRMMDVKATEKGLKLVVEIDESLPLKLKGDDVRIHQILVNLINNAIKYTETGSITLSVGGQKQDDKQKLSFSVKDTGIGIKKEDMEKLFDKFARIEERRNRHIEGTGLGMTITVQLLSLMNSHLNVNSVYGVGSEFSFDLIQEICDATPIGSISDIRQERTDNKPQHSIFRAPNAKIFMVDDNSFNRKVFTGLLRKSGMSITVAEGGEEALKMLREQKYDVIFLDDMMPDITGTEVLKKMKAEEGHINLNTPVIALTANAVAGVREQYLAAGFDEYLSKPVRLDRLERTLKTYLPEGSWHYEDSNK